MKKYKKERRYAISNVVPVLALFSPSSFLYCLYAQKYPFILCGSPAFVMLFLHKIHLSTFLFKSLFNYPFDPVIYNQRLPFLPKPNKSSFTIMV